MQTSTPNLPSTPAEVAAAVLDQIECYPDAFDMAVWIDGPYTGDFAFPPGTEPVCGTTLCAAGWAASVTGWTIVNGDQAEQVISLLPDGGETTAWSTCYAEKGSERRFVKDVAAAALGLGEGPTFFYDPADQALLRLRQIAGLTEDGEV